MQAGDEDVLHFVFNGLVGEKGVLVEGVGTVGVGCDVGHVGACGGVEGEDGQVAAGDGEVAFGGGVEVGGHEVEFGIVVGLVGRDVVACLLERQL